MSETPIETDRDPSDPATDPGLDVDPDVAPGSGDQGEGGAEPVETDEPGSGLEAPVPAGGSDDADG